MPTSVFSYLTYYGFSFNKAFVPMALELGGRQKECVVMKVWAYASDMSLGESFLPVFRAVMSGSPISLGHSG